MPQPADLEPAVRDPKKLRRTAWILLGIMLIGGWLVLKAYERWSVQQSSDTRPALFYKIGKERDLRLIRQDGKTAELFDLRGHVWAIHVVSLKQPATAERSLAVMKHLAAAYANQPDFNLVTLVVDPIPSADVVAALSQAAASQDIKLPQWWLGSSQDKTLHTFIKNELKANVFPHEENGQWVFDTSIVLVDRNGTIRRAVVPQQRGGDPYIATFDFDQAEQWDARGVKTGTSRNNVAELEALLRNTIDILLAEPAVKP